MELSRRSFIGTAALAAAGCATKSIPVAAAVKPEYHVFSRVFQFI